jgi:hypothetical protein
MWYHKKGSIPHLLLAAIMTVVVIVIAVFLSSMSSSPVIPAIALINADYQAESAMIMQMQKSRHTPLEKLRLLEKEIMPGVLLKLESNTADGEKWNFRATISGHGIAREILASADISRPDQLVFLQQ